MTVLPTICSTVRRWTLSCGLVRPRAPEFFLVQREELSKTRPHSSSGSVEHRTWPLHWRSSVPVGLRTSRATHLVERSPPVALRQFASRDATGHAAAAPFSASRSSECREQPCAAARRGPSFETSPNTRAGASLGQTSCCSCCFQRGHGGTVSMSTKSGLLVQEEPSTTKNSSSSRAPKTGAQLRDNPEEREKWPKKSDEPLHRRHNRHVRQPSAARCSRLCCTTSMSSAGTMN